MEPVPDLVTCLWITSTAMATVFLRYLDRNKAETKAERLEETNDARYGLSDDRQAHDVPGRG